MGCVKHPAGRYSKKSARSCLTIIPFRWSRAGSLHSVGFGDSGELARS